VRIGKKMKSNIVIKKYPEEHYYTFFNQNTGFFARIEENGHEEPFWSIHGPELLDVSITNWCDRSCLICYRNSNINGKHIVVEDYERILKQAKAADVFQIALGGGNPNQHPNFIKLLELTRSKYDIIPSYTTNGRGLTKDILKASKEYCGAVAVSAYNPFCEMKKAIELLGKYDIKTNIHFLLSSESVQVAIDWLNCPPKFLKGINAIIFLNYKPVGNNKNYKLLLSKSNKLQEFFELASKSEYSFKIGFDSCSVSGIVKYMDVESKYYEACEAGRFSAFISEDMKMYPCSFMEESFEGYDLRNKHIKDIWINGKSFIQTRNELKNATCFDCKFNTVCMGGCPIIKDINLCNENT